MNTVCAECGEIVDVFETGTVAGHTESAWIVDGVETCRVGGSRHKECTVCGALLEEETFAPHEPSGVWVEVKAPTCEVEGEKAYICQICGEVWDTETVAALGHNFQSGWSLNRTLKTHSRTCTKCGLVDTANCDYNTVVTAATCTEWGFTTYTCTVCNDTYALNYIEPLGHDLTDWADCGDETHERHCIRTEDSEGAAYSCDYAEVEEHLWSEWVYNEDGTFFHNGTKTKTCVLCGGQRTETAHHTSFICKVFYPLINWLRNIVDKTQYVASIDWLFPWLTKYIEM